MVGVVSGLPAPKGLFAHIQENNIRSIALFAWFVVLLEAIYIATSVILIALGSPIETMVRISIGDVRAGDLSTSLNSSGDGPFAAIPKDAWEIWTRFWERDALVGSIGLVILLLALLYVVVGLWMSSAITRRQASALRVSRQDEPRLYGLVEPMAIARGLPMPKLEVVPSVALNAYASGMSPTTSVIGVTRGLLDALTDAELEAVLAHEFAHIENRDNRLMTIANLCARLITSQSRQTVEYIRENLVQTVVGFVAVFYLAAWEGLFIGYAAIILAFFLADGVKHLISQKREFLADARAIEMVKDPAALMTALCKIAKNDSIEGMDPNLQAMMISNVSGTDQWTHPSIEARIAAISATTNVLLEDALALAPRRSRSHWAGQREAFGKRRTSTLSDMGPWQAVEHSEGAAPHKTFGKRKADPAVAANELNDRSPQTVNAMWKIDEHNPGDMMKPIDVAGEMAAANPKAVSDGWQATVRQMWILPFILVLLTPLPISLSLPVLVGLAWFGWFQMNRRKAKSDS